MANNLECRKMPSNLELCLSYARRLKAAPPLRIRNTRGRRNLPEGWEDLREEDFYLTDVLPPLLAMTYLPIADTCTLCLNLRSHPVM